MLLVFGLLPKITGVANVLPSQFDRIRAMRTARENFASIIARKRVNLEQKTRPPAAADSNLDAGDMVYVYREKKKSWIGPFLCILRKGKKVFVAFNNALKSFNINQVKKVYIENPSSEFFCPSRRNSRSP